MSNQPSNPLKETLLQVASELESRLEGVKLRGAEAFRRGEVGEIAYHLELFTWAAQACETLRCAAGEVQVEPVAVPEVPAVVPAAPVPARDPVAPPPQPPPTAPEPDHSELKAEIAARVRPWLASAKAAMAQERWDEKDEMLAKAQVCEGRRLLEAGRPVPLTVRKVGQQLGFLGEEFVRKTETKTFFAFNLNATYAAERWADLAQAYTLAGEVYDVLDWLSTSVDLPFPARKSMLTTGAAAEANLHRKLDAMGRSGVDNQQRTMHEDLLSEVGEAFFVQVWTAPADGGPSDQSVLESAKGISGMVAAQKQELQAAAARTAKSIAKGEQSQHQLVKLKELGELVADGLDRPDFAEVLVRLVDDLMDLELAPTNKQLGLFALPYRAELEASHNKRTKRVLEHLNAEFTKLAQRGLRNGESETDIDLPDAQFERVVKALSGKRVLFVGGNKGQGWRQKEYKDRLGVSDLIWPDFEEHTKVSRMMSHVDSADVVCYLIRWSRHSYKDILDRAKELGKECLTLKRGVGINTFVQTYDAQVLGGPKEA